MSADFWCSSQRNKWQLSRQSLLEARRKVLLLERKMIQNGLIKDYPNIHYDFNMRIYLHNLLIKLGRRLNIRQVALATAEIYLNRFLTRVSLKEINVYLLVTTCLYVACKIEECPQHIRLIISEARNLWPEYIPHDVTKLAEFEFYLIEEMDSYLFLHHPYKSLIQIRDFLNENSAVFGFTLTDDELQNAWSLVNDSYITDLHLLLPPHIIAVASIYITIVLKKNLSAIRVNSSAVNSNGGPNSMMFNRNPDQNSMHIDDLMILANPSTPGSDLVNNLERTNFHDMKLDEETIKINKFMNFLDHSHINLDEVVEAMQDMINIYVQWNRYNEQGVKKALQVMLLNRQL
ncbi:RNA polymerase II holoenzyme cyclin-like subunit [Scheffersomyces stipitis CBS 6054]|uniref:RNA polymerase II holoenzyme cyclin-like subunit n=1 Tax=Scheffersomyces stipitis (strain ATCC 58785 / CBS 6054 / NBRC 10063 / NRRL Y-11545) TaxID=322104 RepID=SSN8_PICST|nr:RNA polymerase II holoenzyme cyclin-like subunit [Scheffersomyces stipitis CBS 6054]A3LPX1.2 RecName: Full=RNA polymerase II holoenzyme cyclin-like subunit [Scheffersomyces stipitis CBS 6054]ABN64572.2 RNA polymerase II holoenzyme cyclin-like subunit [Scheffersomyces stipitis CBS 6054]